MKRLHAAWGDRVQFLEVLIREAHPGGGVPAYKSHHQKMKEARRYRGEERIPWDILVDELDGRTHQVYGGLSDPAYLIDADGYIAYYNIWTNVPRLHEMMGKLIEQRGRGTVGDGIAAAPKLLPAIVDGWRAIRRGFPRSYIDLEIALPGSGITLFLGNQTRSVLGPLARRAEPLPRPARIGIQAGAFALGVGAGFLLYRRLNA